MRGKTASRLVRLALASLGLVLILLGGYGLVLFVYSPFPTTFNVTAETERIEFFAENEPESRWTFYDARVGENYSDSTHLFSGSFQLAAGVHVLIERIALGPLWIHVEAQHADQSAGTYYVADDPVGRAARTVEFLIPDLAARARSGETLVLPITDIQGNIRTGRPIGIDTEGSSAVLRSGRVTLLDQSLLGSRIYEAVAEDLHAGDEFTIEDPESPAYGFIVADERPALTVAYRVVGRNAYIQRPGGTAFRVSASLLDRFLHDHLFQGLSLFSGILVVIFTILTSVMQTWTFWTHAQQTEKPKQEPTQRGSTTGIILPLALMVLYLMPSPLARAQEVFLQAGNQVGQGTLRSLGDDCVVVTPHHVVEQALGGIEISGPYGLKAEGVLQQAFEPDLAIVRIDNGNLECSTWSVPDDFEQTVSRNPSGHLSMREYDGSLSLMPVTFRNVGAEYIIVQPTNPDDTIEKGMSGASLFINGQFGGLLFSVDDNDAGTVYQVDDIVRLTEPLFGSSASRSDQASGAFEPVVLEGFVFDLHACEKTGSVVTCRFTVTSQDMDQRLIVYVNVTRIVDETGTEYRAQSGSVGAKRSRSSIVQTLVADTPTEMTIAFTNIFVDRARLLEIRIAGFELQYQDVPFPR